MSDRAVFVRASEVQVEDGKTTRKKLLEELDTLRSRVAELEEIEKSLRASESMHLAMMDAINDGIHINDAEGRYIAANAETARRQGLSKEEVLGKTPLDLYESDKARIAMDHYRHIMRTGEAMEVEMAFRNRNAQHRHIHRSPMRNEAGEIIGVVTVSRDITARKMVEEELRRERDFTSAVLDTMGGLLLVLDREARIVRINRAFERVSGYSFEEVKDQPILKVFPLAGASGREKGVLEAAASGQFPTTGEDILRTRDNRERLIRWTSTTLLDHAGCVDYIISVGSDVTEYRQARESLQTKNTELTRWTGELEQRNRESILLNQMGDLLQTCLTFDEAYSVVAHSAPKLFPSTAGGLFIISASRNLVDAVATWGDFPPTEKIFTPDQCWALRRGRVHTVEAMDTALVCRHIDSPLPSSYLCVPMMAQGETLGSLHIRIDDESSGSASDKERLAITVAEHISLALANLRLQQTLRDQAIHDLLTGLFNRRYMEEMLERELLRAARRGTTVGIIMMDIDHFKQFNDVFGHDAGDSLLSGLGGYLRSHVRGEDIACRYGGEEIALILPDSTLEDTRTRAEELRQGIASLRVENRRQSLGPVTVSMGVAVFPEHGANRDSLLSASDRALYEAKTQGRDRVCIAAGSATLHRIGVSVKAS